MSRKPKDRVEEYIASAVEQAATVFLEELEHICSKCESPIERLLMAAMFSQSRHQPFTSIEFMQGDELPDRPAFDQAAFVYSQIKFGQYRVDLAIWDASLPFELANPRIMVVECDGHDFHEKTKEQALRDKRRDRFLQSRGYKVLRFTGSEIWADPDGCADEIYSELAIDDDWRNRRK